MSNVKIFHSLGLPFSIVFGILFPYGEGFYFLVTPVLIFLLFTSLIKIDAWYKNYNLLLISKILISIILVSVVVFCIGDYVNLNIDWFSGLLLIALSPAALSSPVIIGRLKKGDVALGIQISVITNILAIFYIPLFFYFFMNKSISIDTWVLGKDLLLIVGIPLVLSYVTKKTTVKKIFTGWESEVSFWLLCFIVWIIFSKNAGFIINGIQSFWLFFIGVFLLAVFNYFLGYFVGKKSITTSVSMGHKNTILTVWICSSFLSPQSAIVPAIYIVSHHIINSFLISLRGRD